MANPRRLCLFSRTALDSHPDQSEDAWAGPPFKSKMDHINMVRRPKPSPRSSTNPKQNPRLLLSSPPCPTRPAQTFRAHPKRANWPPPSLNRHRSRQPRRRSGWMLKFRPRPSWQSKSSLCLRSRLKRSRRLSTIHSKQPASTANRRSRSTSIPPATRTSGASSRKTCFPPRRRPHRGNAQLFPLSRRSSSRFE